MKTALAFKVTLKTTNSERRNFALRNKKDVMEFHICEQGSIIVVTNEPNLIWETFGELVKNVQRLEPGYIL